MSKIKVGDLVKVKEKFLYPNQDVLILPYSKDTIGLVVKMEDAGYIYDSDHNISSGVHSSIFGKYVTVKWSGVDTTLPVDDEYVHLEQELEVVSKARKK